MKPNPDLEALLDRANAKGIFGTKMRSVIKLANPAGIAAAVAQQFDEAKRCLRRLDVSGEVRPERQSELKSRLEDIDKLRKREALEPGGSKL
jgi:fructose-bisphosphate aldolase class I